MKVFVWILVLLASAVANSGAGVTGGAIANGSLTATSDAKANGGVGANNGLAATGGARAKNATGKEQIVRFANSRNVGEINPHLYSPNEMFAQNMVYDALVAYDEKTGKILPSLAVSWRIEQGGKRYVFRLREGVKFSDGTPFNAHAVKANVDAILANASRHAWLELVNVLKSCQVLGDLDVALDLSAPYEPTLRELSLPRPFRFIAPHAMKNGGTKDGIKAPIGTGAWKLTQSRQGVSDTFARNEHYWGKKPFFDGVLVKVIPDPNTKIIALKTHQVDYIYGTGEIPLDVLETLKKDYDVIVSEPVNTITLALNSAKFPTSDVAVRKALNYVLDKDEIARAVFYGTQRRADFLFDRNTPYCNISAAPYEFNAQKAAKILDDGGWRLSKNGLRYKDGKPLEMELVFIGQDAAQKAIAEILQAKFKELGGRIILRADESTIFYKKQRTGDFALIFNETWGAPFDPIAFMVSMRLPSHADYQAQKGLANKAQIDADISELSRTFDEKKRSALIQKLLVSFHEEAVYLPITYASIVSITSKKIGGAQTTPFKSYVPFDRLFLK
ncbi:MAG: nickel ABC transporter substrate-binding protein [Helicobacteraceae bacterium]